MEEQAHRARIRAQFGGSADLYVRSETHSGGDDLGQLVSWAEGGSDRIALDVATGGGHTALALAALVGRVVATDLTPRMLESAAAYARELGVENVDFQEADAENLPFPDNQFDLVSCRIAPHHFPRVARFIQEAARVLKPGGVFLLEDSVVPDDPGLAAFLNRVEKLRDATHVRTLSEVEWRTLIDDAGLRIEATRRIPKAHPFDSWVGRSRTPEPIQQELERAFRDANRFERAAFAIVTDADGKIASYTDEKLLVKARKKVSTSTPGA